MWCFDKKLSYRRVTMRRAMSVNTMLNVAKMFIELHVKDLHYSNDLQGFQGYWNGV